MKEKMKVEIYIRLLKKYKDESYNSMLGTYSKAFYKLFK